MKREGRRRRATLKREWKCTMRGWEDDAYRFVAIFDLKFSSKEPETNLAGAKQANEKTKWLDFSKIKNVSRFYHWSHYPKYDFILKLHWRGQAASRSVWTLTGFNQEPLHQKPPLAIEIHRHYCVQLHGLEKDLKSPKWNARGSKARTRASKNRRTQEIVGKISQEVKWL